MCCMLSQCPGTRAVAAAAAAAGMTPTRMRCASWLEGPAATQQRSSRHWLASEQQMTRSAQKELACGQAVHAAGVLRCCWFWCCHRSSSSSSRRGSRMRHTVADACTARAGGDPWDAGRWPEEQAAAAAAETKAGSRRGAGLPCSAADVRGSLLEGDRLLKGIAS
jgi:hypothetical protein